MEVYSLTLWIFSLAVGAAVILRGKAADLLKRFPYFYSYLVCVSSGSLITLFVYCLKPQAYPKIFWFYFLINLFAEFGVLVEISDHIFGPYPAIRLVGRLSVLGISAAFFALYILPSILQPRSTALALLDFALRISLTKALVIGAVLVLARYYHLHLGKNVAGLLLGFAVYLGVYVTSFAAAQAFGNTLYANVLRHVNPLGYTTCLLVWMVAMWKYEPVRRTASPPPDRLDPTTASLATRLTRFDSSLMRLIRK